VQFLGGPDEIRTAALGRMLAAILWVTLVVAPLALLLLLQIQFLPYHNWWITWLNRIALVLDLGLIWWLWGIKILRSSANHSKARSWRSPVVTSIAVVLAVCTMFFAWTLATIPGEWQEDHLPYHAALGFLRARIFTGPVDYTTRRRRSFISNTLVLPGFDIYEALKIDDPKKVEWKQHLIDLRGRDLRGAWLERAVLTRADLTGAQLQRANLGLAQLKGVWLDRAQLQGTILVGAQLQGASLERANLDGASLEMAQLQGAYLGVAELQGALLAHAHLQGADLHSAELQGASLISAQLQGASLQNAKLQGAFLGYARLQGASLQGAQLQGAWLGHASLWRAQLKRSVFENIFDAGGKINWSPIETNWTPIEPDSPSRTWTDATYAELRQSIEREVPQGSFTWGIPEVSLRNLALDRVAILDCEKRDDDALASCDPSDLPPDAVKQWKKMLEAASVDPNAYAKALTAILGDLLCSHQADRLDVLHGLLITDRGDTNPDGPALLKRITSTECPLSVDLTDADNHYVAAASGGKPP